MQQIIEIIAIFLITKPMINFKLMKVTSFTLLQYYANSINKIVFIPIIISECE